LGTQVTLHVFSGRPDPSWQLTPKQEREFEERLRGSQTITAERPSGLVGGLGYRGFSVRRSAASPFGDMHLLVHEGIFDQGTGLPNLIDPHGTEQWLLTTGGRGIVEDLANHVSANFRPSQQTFANLLTLEGDGCPACVAIDAPTYEPTRWNIPTVQPYNNCYNYANNRPTNTFAQPGRASGHPNSVMSCAKVSPAAQYDGLRPVGAFNDAIEAGEGYYIALVVWPGQDYHWYRQDRNGCWSHKPGQTAARNVDNAGQKITNPQTCDRGPYSDFCGYMVTNAGLVIS
jgi:hypothetical protein